MNVYLRRPFKNFRVYHDSVNWVEIFKFFFKLSVALEALIMFKGMPHNCPSQVLYQTISTLYL